MQFKITRDKIPINSINASYMITPKTGYIKISHFAKTTYDEFKTELTKLKQSNIQNLILDLRGNGGGYMQAALDIADELIDAGKLMLYTQGNLTPRTDFNSQKGGLLEEGRLIILIDEGSASASEIVSGAIQDWDRGVIIGRRSFGKGLVQRQFQMPDKSELRLTIARYYTPSGRCIQKSYDENITEYRKEVRERYIHGELTNPDSIQQRNDLEYRTLKNKRTVYGGGGIMPDIFVPLDTLMFTNFYSELISLGVYNKFMMSYIDNNRNTLSSQYTSYEQFNRDYKVDTVFFNQLLADAEKSEIKMDYDQIAISEYIIKMQMKAFIARHLWTTTEYYRVINQTFPVIQKAVEMIEDKKTYNNVLSGK
jgi:carboxyl-terminal processing protease